MSDYFEGDLIRPLGLMTLHFGYAEAQVNLLMSMLRECGIHIAVAPAAPLRKRIEEITVAVRRLAPPSVAEILAILEESNELIDRRNSLVHGSVLAKGRVIPNDPGKAEFFVTPEALTALANQVFNWKERLNAAVQLKLLPALREKVNNGA